MRAKQGKSFNLIPSSWVVEDYLVSLLKKTEVFFIMLNFTITNSGEAGVEAIDVMDRIDVKLTRDGNKKLVDCTLGDLQRDCMIKHKTNYGNIATIGGGSTKNIEIPIPFVDKSMIQPKDTLLIVDTLESLQLEMRYNPATNLSTVAISAVETMVAFDNCNNSLRVTSDRYLLRQGFVVPGALTNHVQPYGEAHYSLALLTVDTPANISILEVQGDNEQLVYGEPDELTAVASDILEINPPDTAITGTGELLTDRSLPIAFIPFKGGYGETKTQKIALTAITSGAVSGTLFTDSVSMPSPARIERHIKKAMPMADANKLFMSAVKKSGVRVQGADITKLAVMPQIKISTIGKEAVPAGKKAALIKASGEAA